MFFFVSKAVNSTINLTSLSVGHVWRTSELANELGITLGDQSTSSVRKRANTHWHALIATAALRHIFAFFFGAEHEFLRVCFFLLLKWWKTSCSFGKEPLCVWCGCDGVHSVGRTFNERVSAHNRLALLYCCVVTAISLCVSAPVESKFLKEHTRFDPASFSRCHSERVLQDTVATWPLEMVTITASRVLASHTLRWHSWMVHVLTAGTWPSQC